MTVVLFGGGHELRMQAPPAYRAAGLPSMVWDHGNQPTPTHHAVDPAAVLGRPR